MDDDGQVDLLVHNSNDRVYGFLGPISAGDQTSAEYDFSITGTRYEYIGQIANAGGDFDGDGVTDLALGVPAASDRATSAGAAYVFFGPINSDRSTGSADLEVYSSTENESVGVSVSLTGDTDGDGTDDLVVGANGTAGPWVSGGGGAYIYPGGTSGSVRLSDASATLVGETYTCAGDDVAAAGDVDGDGMHDLVVGAGCFNDGTYSGRVHVVLAPFSASVDLASAYAILEGPTLSNLGSNMITVGELDGSPRGMLVGGMGWTSGGWSRGGAWYSDLGGL